MAIVERVEAELLFARQFAKPRRQQQTFARRRVVRLRHNSVTKKHYEPPAPLDVTSQPLRLVVRQLRDVRKKYAVEVVEFGLRELAFGDRCRSIAPGLVDRDRVRRPGIAHRPLCRPRIARSSAPERHRSHRGLSTSRRSPSCADRDSVIRGSRNDAQIERRLVARGHVDRLLADGNVVDQEVYNHIARGWLPNSRSVTSKVVGRPTVVNALRLQIGDRQICRIRTADVVNVHGRLLGDGRQPRLQLIPFAGVWLPRRFLEITEKMDLLPIKPNDIGRRRSPSPWRRARAWPRGSRRRPTARERQSDPEPLVARPARGLRSVAAARPSR